MRGIGTSTSRGVARLLLLGVLPLLAVAPAALAATKPTKAQLIRAAMKHRLTAAPTCDPFLAYVRRKALEQVGPYGLGGSGVAGGAPLPVAAEGSAPDRGAAPVAGVDFSGTNVQEAGVDEPDLVKSDGRTMFTVADGSLRAVRLDGAASRLVGSLAVKDVSVESLLLSGRRLLVMGQRYPAIEPVASPPTPSGSTSIVIASLPTAVLIEVDVSAPAAMRVTATQEIPNTRVVDARLTGSTARVVLSSTLPAAIPFTTPDAAGGVDQATAANRVVIERSTADQWVPTATLTRNGTIATRPLVPCPGIRLPARYSGLALLTILTLDLRQELNAPDADAIVSDSEIVYASTKALYVTTTRWFDTAVQRTSPAIGPHTVIHRFDTRDPVRTRYRASGSVSGFLNRQWSMSEHRGYLRVASTEEAPWISGGSDSQSFVTVLDEAAGTLIPVGRVGGIGRGEQVYAVRFIGDEGYIVTFRRVDPLHVLDLSDPVRPRVVGELVIPGYSAYLHPIGPGRLLGVGQEADPTGRVIGAQVSVFDVSDPRRPRRLQRMGLGRAWTEAEWDHKAFLYWPPTGLTVLPLQAQVIGVRGDDGGWFSGAVALRASAGGVVELGRLEHPMRNGESPIRRSLVARGNLYTVSHGGVLVSALDGLGRRAWVPFG